MRHSMIKGNKVPKYLLYAVGEIILVVIGILIAVQINNWNEARKERLKEEQVLKEIMVDLERSIVSLENDVTMNERARDTIDYITTELNKEKPSDSIVYALSLISNNSVATLHTSGYDNLRNLGFSIIKNDSLRKEINTLYELFYSFLKDTEAKDNEITYNYFLPNYLEYFESIESSNSSPSENLFFPKEYDALRTQEFIKLINYYKTRKVLVLYDLNYTLKPMYDLESHLKDYIKNEFKE